jgi:hypothetical protein
MVALLRVVNRQPAGAGGLHESYQPGPRAAMNRQYAQAEAVLLADRGPFC